MAALKGLHRVSIVRESNSLKNFAFNVINEQSREPTSKERLISLVFSKFSQVLQNFENTHEIDP